MFLMAGIGTLLGTFVVELVGPSKFPHTLLGRVIGGDDPTLQNLEVIAKHSPDHWAEWSGSFSRRVLNHRVRPEVWATVRRKLKAFALDVLQTGDGKVETLFRLHIKRG